MIVNSKLRARLPLSSKAFTRMVESRVIFTGANDIRAGC
jgi:hypothetical protein